MASFEGPIERTENPANVSAKKRTMAQIEQLHRLLEAMQRRELAEEPFSEPLADLDELLASEQPRAAAFASIKARIERILEHEYGLIRPEHHQNQWMALGMSAFGVPIGVLFSLILDNMAFIGIGLPIGLAIGIAIGAQKDKEARAAGKVLDLESASE
jgi:hypothetical protein